MAPAEKAGDKRADDVEQADSGQSPGTEHGSEIQIEQISRKMGGDESDVKPTYEKSGIEQPVTTVATGLTQRTGETLCALCRLTGFIGARQAEGKRHYQAGADRQYQ